MTITKEMKATAWKNGITTAHLYNRIKKLGWDKDRAITTPVKHHNPKKITYEKDVAVYRGDDLLCIGTVKECAKELGVREETILFYSMPSYKKRLKRNENIREVVFLDE